MMGSLQIKCQIASTVKINLVQTIKGIYCTLNQCDQSTILSYQNSPVIATFPCPPGAVEAPAITGFVFGISTPPATISRSLTLTPTSARRFVKASVSFPGGSPIRKRRPSRHSTAVVFEVG